MVHILKCGIDISSSVVLLGRVVTE